MQADNLRTEKGHSIKDLLYPGDNSVLRLDITNPRDLWTLVYFAALIKQGNSENDAKEVLSRYIRLRQETGDVLGREISAGDEKSTRALRYFASLGVDVEAVENFLREINGEYLPLLEKLVQAAQAGKTLDIASDEGLKEVFFWLEAVKQNGFWKQDDLQILKNVLTLLNRGASRDGVIEEAVKLHLLMLEKEKRSYSCETLAKILDIKELTGDFGLAVDLSALMTKKIDADILRQALQDVQEYQNMPYYQYLIFKQYVCKQNNADIRGLIPYVVQLEQAAGWAQVGLDFASRQGARDFDALLDWARAISALEAMGYDAQKLCERAKDAFLVDRRSVFTKLYEKEGLMDFMLGKSDFIEITGENREALDKQLAQVEAFLKELLKSAGVKGFEQYLERINSYKFMTSAIVTEAANKAEGVIFIPYRVLTARNSLGLAQALVHEIGALWGFNDSTKKGTEIVFNGWINTCELKISPELKEGIQQRIGKESISRHQAGEESEEYPLPDNKTMAELLQNSAFTEIFFGVSSYEQWYDTYSDNQNAWVFAGTQAYLVETNYGSISAYISHLNTVEDLSYALNNASGNIQGLFAEVYGESVQQLSWQTPGYLEALFDIVCGPKWISVSEYMAFLGITFEFRQGVISRGME
ncbi:MAG: hypothetical protein WAX79_05930, partial [Candidatus Omnitrophota bacterium]